MEVQLLCYFLHLEQHYSFYSHNNAFLLCTKRSDCAPNHCGEGTQQSNFVCVIWTNDSGCWQSGWCRAKDAVTDVFIYYYFLVVFVLTIWCLEAQPEEQSSYDCEVSLPVEKCIFFQDVCLKDSKAALMTSEDHQHILMHQNKSSKSQSRQRVKSQFT